QLIAGTHRDLRAKVADGSFREDLFARINLWTFALPGLAARREDIEPNLDFELQRHAREQNRQVRFNLEAKRRYLAFALAAEARWAGNFRELSASVTRMATLADSGRIDEALVEEEIGRLRHAWGLESEQLQLPIDQPLDLFDQVQLQAVIDVCRRAASLSEAGRTLFAVSRQEKANPNDADRLRKYLARFGLDWQQLKS
ncbi:MAG: sigma 54-interacting transcriptional regulator, partial [Pseudomonas farsensis]